MLQCKQISQDILVGAQPDEEGLQKLAANDVASVLNLGTFSDDDESLSPNEEGICAQELGMEYLSIPISENEFTPHCMNDFRSKLDFMAKPVFVHCRSGEVAAAFVLMDLAAQNDWSAEATLQKADELDIGCENADLRAFVRSYSDHQSD